MPGNPGTFTAEPHQAPCAAMCEYLLLGLFSQAQNTVGSIGKRKCVSFILHFEEMMQLPFLTEEVGEFYIYIWHYDFPPLTISRGYQ